MWTRNVSSDKARVPESGESAFWCTVGGSLLACWRRAELKLRWRRTTYKERAVEIGFVTFVGDKVASQRLRMSERHGKHQKGRTSGPVNCGSERQGMSDS